MNSTRYGLVGLLAVGLVGLAWLCARRHGGSSREAGPVAALAFVGERAAAASGALPDGSRVAGMPVERSSPAGGGSAVADEMAAESGVVEGAAGAIAAPPPAVAMATGGRSAAPARAATTEPEISHFPGVTVRFAPSELEAGPGDPPAGEVQEIVTPSGHRLLRVRADKRAEVGIRPPPAR